MLDVLRTYQRELLTAGVPMLIALVVVLRAGWLSPRALDAGPDRAVGLTGLDLLVGLIFPLLVAVQFIAAALGFGRPGAGAGDGQALPQTTADVLAGVLMGQAVMQLPFVLWLLWRSSARVGGLRRIGVVATRPLRDIIVALVAVLIALALVLGVNTLVVVFGEMLGYAKPDIGHDLLRVLRDAEWSAAAAGLLLAAVVLAPLLEEFYFRGLIQSALREVGGGNNRWTCVLLSSAIFTMVHTAVAWQVMPGLFVLGVILGWLYERTGSLWPCVLVHAGFNAVNVLLTLWLMEPTTL